MLHDKKSDTDGEKQKVLLRRLVGILGDRYPDLYYQSTSQVARLIQDAVAEPDLLNADERKLMEPLGQRDIEILLSMH
jgi:hypothetical protein